MDGVVEGGKVVALDAHRSAPASSSEAPPPPSGPRLSLPPVRRKALVAALADVLMADLKRYPRLP
jgi:hypothetical protein